MTLWEIIVTVAILGALPVGALAQEAFILIGPGRWGTRDVRLGVPVRYADIIYLPLSPDDPGTRINHAFGSQTANSELFSADVQFASVVRVISIPRANQGRRLAIDMDVDSDRAIAYLSK